MALSLPCLLRPRPLTLHVLAHEAEKLERVREPLIRQGNIAEMQLVCTGSFGDRRSESLHASFIAFCVFSLQKCESDCSYQRNQCTADATSHSLCTPGSLGCWGAPLSAALRGLAGQKGGQDLSLLAQGHTGAIQATAAPSTPSSSWPGSAWWQCEQGGKQYIKYFGFNRSFNSCTLALEKGILWHLLFKAINTKYR